MGLNDPPKADTERIPHPEVSLLKLTLREDPPLVRREKGDATAHD